MSTPSVSRTTSTVDLDTPVDVVRRFESGGTVEINAEMTHALSNDASSLPTRKAGRGKHLFPRASAILKENTSK
jgi:hypothetical protein